MYSSEIICKGCGLSPVTASPPKKFRPTRCMACGRPLSEPQEALSWKPTNNFADWQYLHPGPVQAVCRYCATLLNQTLLVTLAKAVVSEHDGVFDLAKDSHLTWFLQSPPRTPFVAMFSPMAQRRAVHLFWKAVPTLDASVIYVQHGDQSLSIRRPILARAVRECARAAEIARDEGISISAHHPFQALSRRLDLPTHSTVRTDILDLAGRNQELHRILDFLLDLTAGELWALSVLAKSTPSAPLQEKLTF